MTYDDLNEQAFDFLIRNDSHDDIARLAYITGFLDALNVVKYMVGAKGLSPDDFASNFAKLLEAKII